MPYFVYMLECCNGSYYTGYTTDIDKRYKAHQQGRASKYTRSFPPVKIVAHWELTSLSEALKLECAIKKLNRRRKELLVQQPDALQHFC